MQINKSDAIVINAPEFFADAAFQAWLNDSDNNKFTLHTGGAPTEWSDTIVLVDPSLDGQGSDSDMPKHIWDQIIAICQKNFTPHRGGDHIMVRLLNLV